MKNLGAARVEPGSIGPVYHGTRAEFFVFDTAPAPVASSKFQLLLGSHFTEDRGFAAMYARGAAKGLFTKRKGEARILHATLRLRRYLDLTSAAEEVPPHVVEMLPAPARAALDKANHLTWSFDRSRTGAPPLLFMLEKALHAMPPAEARALLERAGYDGIRYTATYRNGYRDPSWIVFRSEDVEVTRVEVLA